MLGYINLIPKISGSVKDMQAIKYLQKAVCYSIYHDLVWLTDRHINVSAAQTVDMNYFYLPSKQNRLDAFAKGL